MQSDSEPVIKIRDLNYRYPGYNTVPATALSGINLDILKGDKVVITGPSGSGKSSLLRCINGLIPNSDRNGEFSGDVSVAGLNTKNHSAAEISRHLGTVFQNPDHQIVSSRVDSEIAFGPENMGVPPDEIELKITDIGGLLGISHLLKKETSDLSWGEKQKVAIASVLVMQPEIIILDEPFSGLDPSSSVNLSEILETLNRELNITIVLAEHRIENLNGLMDRLILMKEGEIIYDGCPCDNLLPVSESYGVIIPPFGRTKKEINSLICSLPNGRQKTDNVALELENVTFMYPDSASPAIEGISLKLYNSEITVILGSNGSGKSTLSKHLNGILKPDSGKIILPSEDLSGSKRPGIAGAVGLVSQHADHQLFGENIIEEFSFGPVNVGISGPEIKTRIPKMVRELNLERIGINTPLLKLSVGEKQRIAIGSVLMMDTPVVVLDEPTIGLDYKLKNNLAEMLQKLVRNQRSVVVMTHDLEFASICADRVVVMDDGKISFDSLNPSGVDVDGI